MSDPQHSVVIQVGGRSIAKWTEYQVANDMLSASDDFSLSRIGFTVDEYNAIGLDSELKIYLDDTPILSGFVEEDDGESSREASALSLNGRDRVSRLVDEAAPLISFNGLGLVDLVKKMADPWLTNVVTSNATNRRLVGGSGAKMGAISREPAIDVRQHANRKVQPGEKRWQVIDHFAKEAQVLVWAAANGTDLVVGKPNYDQAATFRFFHAMQGSKRASECNVEKFRVHRSVADRYSQITAVGTANGDDENYGDVITCRGQTSDGPGADGVGGAFKFPKRLLVADDSIKSNKLAKIRAEREMAERNASGLVITVDVKGHGQQISGARRPTLFAFDTVADVESEQYGIKGRFLLTSVNFSLSKQGGERTTITMVPKGTVLIA